MSDEAEKMIRVKLPLHLRRLAGDEDASGYSGEVTVSVRGPVTQRSVVDALESRFPSLTGAVRDRGDGRRRSLVRFYACGEDLSNDDPDDPLPGSVASGEDPFMIVGAIAGG